MRPDMSYIYDKLEKSNKLTTIEEKSVEEFVLALEEFIEAAIEYNNYYKENKNRLKNIPLYNESDMGVLDDPVRIELKELENKTIEKLNELEDKTIYKSLEHLLRANERNILNEWREIRKTTDEFLF